MSSQRVPGARRRGSLLPFVAGLLALPKLLILPSLTGAFFAPIAVVTSSTRSSPTSPVRSIRETQQTFRQFSSDMAIASATDDEVQDISPETIELEGALDATQRHGEETTDITAATESPDVVPLVGGVPLPPPSIWNAPNIITMARVVAIPVFAKIFYAPLPQRNIWCAAIFAGAAVTDWLDGYIARSQGIVTPFGAFLDPVADKLMVSTALVLLSERSGPSMSICSAIIICRELAISALREWMAQLRMRDAVKVGNAGKWKTATQMVALSLLLLLEPGAPVTFISPTQFMPIAKGLLYVSTLLTVTSGSGYLKAAWPALMGREQTPRD